jgi:hypothetical protein
MADECEYATSCPVEAPPENELDDPSILTETGAGPVEVGPPVVTNTLTPCDISYLQSNFKQLTNFTDATHAAAVANVVAISAVAAVAAGAGAGAGAFTPSRVFAIARAAAAAAAAAGNDVATTTAAASHAAANRLVEIARHAAVAEGDVPTETQQRDHYGFVKSDEESSTNISETITTGTGGGDPLSYSFQIMAYIESQIKTDVLGLFNELFIDLYASLSAVVTNIPGANPTKGFVGITRCGFLSKYTTVIYYAGRIPYNYREEIVRLIEEYNQEIKQRIERWSIAGVTLKCKVEKSQVQYDTQKIILCITLATGNVIQIPILNVVGFPVFQDVNPLLRLVTPPLLPCFGDDPTSASPQFLSLLDIIVRVRICSNQGAITALSEPSKEEVTLIRSCFQGLITTLPTVISTITQGIYQILYTEANIKAFALFCNIFYNFINVSFEYRSLAKIIYSEFFGTSDNYGKVIRTCQVINSLPIMRDHVKFFLTGSNAARVYLALNEIIKLGTTEPRQPITPKTIEHILKKTFGNLSDNDFMIYLKGQTKVEQEDSEPYRVFIRMILGGSFYFFKDLFDLTMVDPTMLVQYNFTETMIQSVGIVGFMDHLFAQRFDASPAFLHQCYKKDTTSFLANMLRLGHMPYFDQLDKQINVAHLDGVFKYYDLVTFYAKMFHICSVQGGTSGQTLEIVYDFLINKATSIDCIATVWTLVLNVLYTLFVPENCLARIAVGKFDNDPKNLKLYMEILNDHLTELHIMGYDHPEIGPLVDQQKRIILMCEQGIHNGPGIFKQTCDRWFQKMVEMVVSGPPGQGLFMLSVSDAIEIRGGRSTNLERALCLAYLPTAQGNICSASSLLPQSSPFYERISGVLAGHMLYDPNPLIEVTERSTITDENEIALRTRLNEMGSLINIFKTACQGIVLPFIREVKLNPEAEQMSLSSYLNFLWKHLTKRAVKLKIILKENLSDMKRVTGIKYIALVLGGYFQIRLLIDEITRAECPPLPAPCAIREKLDSFKVNKKSLNCKRGLLPLLNHPRLITLIQQIIQMDDTSGTKYTTEPTKMVNKILKILGFLFSIKVKSSSPHSPYQLLRLEDSILIFPFPKDPPDPNGLQILNPTSGMFIEFLRALGVDVTNRAIMKCICHEGGKNEVLRIDTEMNAAAVGDPVLQQLYTAVGGSITRSNRGKKLITDLNNHKYKHNKLARNNRTHRNKNKRKKNSKSKSHKSKSKSKPKSRKSKSGKSKRKNVTFKRRKRSNRH